MIRSLAYILERFPEHAAEIVELYNKDEDFRILCEDYLTSVLALEEWHRNVTRDREYETEFTQINIELEKEIIHLLDAKQK